MSDNSVTHGPPCPDCEACEECGRTAYCLSEPNPLPPCPHGRALCGDDLDACADCRRAMEQEMYASGEYDPLADPLYDTHAEPVDAAYWATVQRAVEVTPGVFRYPEGDSA